MTGSSRKMYRQILPRHTDLVKDVLTLLQDMQLGEEVVFFVCDAEYAYWQLPLHPQERQFYCSILRMAD